MGARSHGRRDIERERLAEAARLLDSALESDAVAVGKLRGLSIVWAALAQSPEIRAASIAGRPRGEAALDLRSLLRPRAWKAFSGLVSSSTIST
jgi:hypothetical protein